MKTLWVWRAVVVALLLVLVTCELAARFTPAASAAEDAKLPDGLRRLATEVRNQLGYEAKPVDVLLIVDCENNVRLYGYHLEPMPSSEMTDEEMRLDRLYGLKGPSNTDGTDDRTGD